MGCCLQVARTGRHPHEDFGPTWESWGARMANAGLDLPAEMLSLV